ncbi:MAG: dicarboxylate/amino acid:cation symporter [Acidobacteriaceae bacterium]
MAASSPTRRYRIAGWLIAAGILLFLCGMLASVVLHAANAHAFPATALRVAGLALLVGWAVWRRSLTCWIFVGMLAGAEIGFDQPGVAVQLSVLSDIFLRLIKAIVAPLILGTLVSGIAGHGDLRGMGRIGLKALVYFEAMTVVALAIGWFAITVTRAGVGLALPVMHDGLATAAAPPLHWQDSLLHAFPDNIARAIAEGQILQVAVFALIFGIALTMVPEERRRPLVRLAESLSETMFRFTNVVMYLAPVGVAAAMAYTVGHMGLAVLVNLAKLLGTLYGALALFALLGMLPVILLARLPLRGFLRAIAVPATIAFSTATSEAALPRAMENMEIYGVPRRIVSFVIPMGYSFNLDGSALYLALASIFVAQAAGVHQSISEQLLMLATLMLTSKGVAGVPRAGLVVLLATVTSFHLPTEPVLVILGIDTLMDMPRTMVNVVGNCLASAVVARWEHAFPQPTESPVLLESALLEPHRD